VDGRNLRRRWMASRAGTGVTASGTDVVRLEVSVIGKDRKPLPVLGASDFTVLENGRERPIVAFTSVSVPTRKAIAGIPTASWVAQAGTFMIEESRSSPHDLLLCAALSSLAVQRA
jgi:hypothetical protein